LKRWRIGAAAEKNLSSPHGWLSAAGLFWLQPGENRMGSGSSNPILLPPGTAPDCAGSFELEGEDIFLTACGDTRLSIDELKISRERITILDESSQAITLNDLEIYVIGAAHAMACASSTLAIRSGLRRAELVPDR
jgi:hypothetical protein